MNIKEIKQNFNQTELLVIKKFLKWVNETTKTDSDFADDASIEQLNQFNEMTEETDADIKTNVREWLRLKKVRLRGNLTDN
jgi:hypothetical protein